MQIEEWVKCVCYFEYCSSLDNQLIHIYPTVDFTQNELKSLFSLSFPRVVGNVIDQFYSFTLSKGENILYGYVYYDSTQSNLPPPTLSLWSSTSSEDEEAEEEEAEEDQEEKKQKTKRKTKKDEKLKTKNKNKKSDVIDPDSESEPDSDPDPDPEDKCGKELIQSGGRSVVILSEHPWESLFFRLLEELGPEILDDPGKLEEWYDFIAENYPKELEIDHCYPEFPLTQEQKLRVFVPGEPKSIFENSGEVSCYRRYMGLDLDIASLLSSSFNEFWKLWQLVITGEPIVVFSPQPEICSQVVRVLSSLIYPFQYQGLVVPYFTKYDSNWNKISSIDFSPQSDLPNHHPKKKNIIIGTTDYELGSNELYYWPNHLFVGLPEKEIEKKKKRDRVKEGLFMDSESIVLVHKKMLKWLNKYQKNVVIDQEYAQKTYAVRDYFFSFTNDFITPLENYINTLLPNFSTFEPFYSRIVLQGFNENEFIKNFVDDQKNNPFEKHEVSDCEQLYRKFIHTKTFQVWYKKKRDMCSEVFWKFWRKSVVHLEVGELFKEGDDPEKINLFMRLNKRLNVAIQYNDWVLYDKYLQLMQDILELLPKEFLLNLKKMIKEKKQMKKDKIEELKKNNNIINKKKKNY
ncbi:protein dennd6b-like [Anaeramoeba flamelloides]|uniref:Protein dennd6b-like n=1 Tax=Anaeramoeba flamelloides TaxID=1746091 RepID=A0ABQ8YVI5_9EUKA|nr:protein dennd6b-like [Anaeramoeba flamelloides]